MDKLTLSDIAKLLNQHTDISQDNANQFVATLFEVVQNGLERDQMVKIKGLGTFKIIGVDARESVNVNTGERVVIESHGKITFTPDSTMKEIVNKPFSQFETVVLNDGVSFDDLVTSSGDIKENISNDFESVEKDDVFEKVADESNMSQLADDDDNEPSDVSLQSTEIEPNNQLEPQLEPQSETEKPSESEIKPVVSCNQSIEDVFPRSSAESNSKGNIVLEDKPADCKSFVEKNANQVMGNIDSEKETILLSSLHSSDSEVNPLLQKDEVNILTSQDTYNHHSDNVNPIAVEDEASTQMEVPPVQADSHDNYESSDTIATQLDEQNCVANEKLSVPDEIKSDSDDTGQNTEGQPTTTRKNVRKWLLYILLSIVFVVLAYFGGYKYGESCALHNVKRVAPTQRIKAIPKPVIKKKATSVKPDTLTSPVNTIAKNDSKKDVNFKNVPITTEEGTWKKYDKMDVRLRTGAYGIVGTAKVIRVKSGETVNSVSLRALGPDMECYIEVYNGLSSKTVLMDGQKLKIPKLELKRHLKKEEKYN